MKIANNITSKEFTIDAYWAGSQIAGNENLWYYDIYFCGKRVDRAYTKTEAKAIIASAVRKVNAVLNKARRLQKEGKLEEALKK